MASVTWTPVLSIGLAGLLHRNLRSGVKPVLSSNCQSADLIGEVIDQRLPSVAADRNIREFRAASGAPRRV